MKAHYEHLMETILGIPGSAFGAFNWMERAQNILFSLNSIAMMQDYKRGDLIIMLLGKLIQAQPEISQYPRDVRGIFNRTLLTTLEGLRVDQDLIISKCIHLVTYYRCNSQ
jgi:hypothetical protein